MSPDPYEDIFEDRYVDVALELATKKGITKNQFGMSIFGHERGMYPATSTGRRQRITLAQAIRIAIVLEMEFVDLIDLVTAKLQREMKRG